MISRIECLLDKSEWDKPAFTLAEEAVLYFKSKEGLVQKKST